jgi:hypothetical protein
MSHQPQVVCVEEEVWKGVGEVVTEWKVCVVAAPVERYVSRRQ